MNYQNLYKRISWGCSVCFVCERPGSGPWFPSLPEACVSHSCAPKNQTKKESYGKNVGRERILKDSFLNLKAGLQVSCTKISVLTFSGEQAAVPEGARLCCCGQCGHSSFY